ncbi:hypothetical protein F511_25433 [Dorcoceras hygrometricum]|uniref:Uncharacterized protein n=1 Tax=Dorcoceras hygrometricum TaxID=472368 RepID=A0A2Z7AKZ9_9LAMI|nr:hypothetical protein F511_25433 [Dorcoceras hygrometricum]
MAEESTKSWADSDSEPSSTSSSSSDSEQEEVHCFMANHTDDDEVFDFANSEFTREDLVQALNDMVPEYKTLSHTFEEIKAENASLKNSSAESSSDELEDTDSLKTELSRLKIENELLRNEASELKAEVDKLTEEMSSWNKANRSLYKLYESQKPLNDKTGVGFNYDSSHGETSTQSQPPDHKGKGKVGIGYQRPENSKPRWLKNKLNEDKAKAGPKFFVPNQPRHYSKKEKTEWTRNQPRRNPYGQNIKSKFKRPARDFAHTFVDPRTGKTVRIVQIWVPKGVIQSGPK